MAAASTTWCRCLKQSPRTSVQLKRAGVAVAVVAVAGLLLGGRGQPAPPTPRMPGWVVVEKSGTGDDTAAIQAAIDSLSNTGGVVFFPAGTYRHTGLTVRAGVHLQGDHV